MIQMTLQVSGKKRHCSIYYFGRMVTKLKKLGLSHKTYILKIPDELKSTRNINKTEDIVGENIRG